MIKVDMSTTTVMINSHPTSCLLSFESMPPSMAKIIKSMMLEHVLNHRGPTGRPADGEPANRKLHAGYMRFI